MIKSLQDDEFKRQIEFLLGMEVELTADEINILAHATIGNEWVFKVLDKLGLTVDDIIYERDRDILTGELSKLYKQPEPNNQKQNQIVDANKMVTGVDWLVNQVENFYCFLHVDMIEKAKEMEKVQIMNGYKHGQNNGYNYRDGAGEYIKAEEYFEQNFKK